MSDAATVISDEKQAVAPTSAVMKRLIAAVAVTAAYYLWALQRSVFGPLTDKIDTSHLHDVSWYEGLPVAVLIALIALFGVFPMLIFSRIDAAVELVLRVFGGG